MVSNLANSYCPLTGFLVEHGMNQGVANRYKEPNERTFVAIKALKKSALKNKC